VPPRRMTHQRSTRKSLWLALQPAAVTLASGASNLVFSLNAAALDLRPFTIVRTRLELMVISDQAAAVEQQIGALGVAVVSDQAVGVGITAVPTPITDIGSSLWFAHALALGQASQTVDNSNPPTRISIDSKAMRKVEVGSDMIVTLELSAIGAGAQFFVGGRILVKTN